MKPKFKKVEISEETKDLLKEVRNKVLVAVCVTAAVKITGVAIDLSADAIARKLVD